MNSTIHVNHLKVMKRFLFNGHTSRFHLQIQKLESAYTAYQIVPCKSTMCTANDTLFKHITRPKI